MLNYVALYTIQALQQGPWRDPTQLGFFKVARFSSSARVPEVLGVHAGWIVALALVALFYVYLRHSKQGYELTVVGENEATARYAGMPVKRVVIRTMFLSAGVCGLAGMLQASGADRTLNDTVAGGVGFTAITVAWLARLNPVGMLIVSVLFCILEKGCASVQSVYKTSRRRQPSFAGHYTLLCARLRILPHPSHLPGEQAGRRRGTWLTASGSTSSSRRSRRACRFCSARWARSSPKRPATSTSASRA